MQNCSLPILARISFYRGMCIILQNCRIGQVAKPDIFEYELSFTCRTVVQPIWPDLVLAGVCAYSCRIVELAKVAKWPTRNFQIGAVFSLQNCSLVTLILAGVCADSCRIVELAIVAIGQTRNFGTELSFPCRTVVYLLWSGFLCRGYVQIPVELQNWPKWTETKIKIFDQELSFACRTLVYPLWPDLVLTGACAYSCRIVELAKVAKW